MHGQWWLNKSGNKFNFDKLRSTRRPSQTIYVKCRINNTDPYEHNFYTISHINTSMAIETTTDNNRLHNAPWNAFEIQELNT
jgi:hypothetical protein